MIASPAVHDAPLAVTTDLTTPRTKGPEQFIDLTDWAAERVRRSGIRHGLASIQVQHTTAALAVNEDEPLLIEDLHRLLSRLAPPDVRYGHDDLTRRGAPAGERPNGAAHCRGLLLGFSQTFHVIDGALRLGRWQRLFLVELDGPRPRNLSIVVLGARADG